MSNVAISIKVGGKTSVPSLYRIRRGGVIDYCESRPIGALLWGDVPREKKRLVFNFIRSYYVGVWLRDVIGGKYFAILEDGFLVGVGFNLAGSVIIRKSK